MQTVSERFEELKGTFACDTLTKHHFSEGLYAKQMTLPAGYEALSHSHAYDHLSILAAGRVIVTTDAGQTEYVAPCCINIVKNTNHSIYALEDASWFCVHATDETDADRVDEVLINRMEN